MSFSVAPHFAVKIQNTKTQKHKNAKTQKHKNAKYYLQCADNQCDMICAVLRSFGKGAKWSILRG